MSSEREPDRQSVRSAILNVLCDVDPMNIAGKDNPYASTEYSSEASSIESQLHETAEVTRTSIRAIVKKVAEASFEDSAGSRWGEVVDRIYHELFEIR